MKTEKTGRSPWVKAFAIGAIVLCILSLLTPWIRFEVKTDRGNIDLNSVTEQSVGVSMEEAARLLQGALEELCGRIDSPEASSQLRVMGSGLIDCIGYLTDSRLTPVEMAQLYTKYGSLISQAQSLLESAQSTLRALGIENADDVLEIMGCGDTEEVMPKVKAMAVVSWLLLAALVAVGIFGICMVAADKRGLIWLEAVLYGVVLLAYGGFALVMNQAISARLTEYASLVGHSIRPFHISLLPVIIFLCLIGSAVADRVVPAYVGPKCGWVCACGVRNPETAAFCASCGTPRGGRTSPKTWVCACGCENEEENRCCTKCGKPRFAHVEPKSSYCQGCGKEIPLGQELCDACRAAGHSGGNTSSTGSLKLNLGGGKEKKISPGFRQTGDNDLD